MCGRYAFGPSQQFQERIERTNLAIDEVRTGRQSTIQFNVSPGRYGPVYRQESTEPDSSGDSTTRHVVDWMRWGVVPSFSSEPKISYTFNARSDTLAQNKGLWNGIKQRNRCVVLADGYYEWQKRSDTHRIPHYVKRKDGNLLCFAGLWDVNTKVTENNEQLFTYTIVTTDAHGDMAWLHDRMPVILEPEDVDKWLRLGDKWNDSPDEFLALLKPMDAGKLEIYQVSPDVGKLSNDYQGLTQPIKDSKATISNFFKKAEENKDTNSGETKKEPQSHTKRPISQSNSPSKKPKIVSPTTTKAKDNKKITSFFKRT